MQLPLEAGPRVTAHSPSPASHFIRYYYSLSTFKIFHFTEDMDNLRTVDQQAKRTEAVGKFLNILGRCKKPGVYSTFMKSLKDNSMYIVIHLVVFMI